MIFLVGPYRKRSLHLTVVQRIAIGLALLISSSIQAADIKQYTLTRDEILSDPIDWAIEEKGVNYKVRSQVVVDRDASVLQELLPSVKDILFAKIFPWPLTSVNYDGEYQLKANLPLQTGKQFDLDFQVLDDLNEEFYDVYYTLQIPTLSKLFLVVSSWEITVRVQPHPRFNDLAIIDISSNLVINDFFLGLEGAKAKLRIDEVSVKIKKDLPGQLADLKSFLENL